MPDGLLAGCSDLEEEIESAFLGPEGHVPERVVYDDSGSHLECNEVRAKFRGKDWRALSARFLCRNASAPHFFDPEARLYFLPAFMLYLIRNPDDSSMIPHTLVSILSPATRGGSKDLLTRMRSQSTVAQRLAIRKFLEFMVRSPEATSFGMEELKEGVLFWSDPS